MKRIYEKPVAIQEAFIANEYVAACYSLACSVGSGNKGDKVNKWRYNETGYVYHEHDFVSGTCTDASANRVITNDGSVVKSVGEYNKDQGWLNGGFDYWDDRNGNGIVDTDDGIYWHTESKTTNHWGQSSVDRRWNHYGVLKPLDSSRPNHS